ncbi:MAG: hypothetical protein NC548_46945, partial [Lachnospiraceae bacterium]|nr:hypothetical protein [Lachnospiraceae bacterium]
MEKLNLVIHVIPLNIPISDLADIKGKPIGGYLSTITTVRVNLVNGGYSIVYPDDVFAELDPTRTIDYIIKLFMSKVPGKGINISLEYHFELNNGVEIFDEDAGSVLVDMEDTLIEIGNNTNIVTYYRSQSMDDVVDMLDDEDDDEDSDQDKDDEEDNHDFDDYEDYDWDNPSALINYLARDGDRKKGKKKGKKYYSESEILHET